MWKCINCEEGVEDNLEVCWNCQADRDTALSSAPSFQDSEEEQLKSFLNKKQSPKQCLGCHRALKYAGKREFHEGINWGAIADFGEMFVSRLNLEMYVCPECLRVEFFISDLG
jgi:hypothetical protein